MSHIIRQNPLFLGDQGKRTLFWSVNTVPVMLFALNKHCFKQASLGATYIYISLTPHTPRFSINAVGVDIAPLSAMPKEEEVLLLPGLPLVNRPGKNPEPDLWIFEVGTPDASSVTSSKMFTSRGSGDSPAVMIDYVHPGISEVK